MNEIAAHREADRRRSLAAFLPERLRPDHHRGHRSASGPSVRVDPETVLVLANGYVRAEAHGLGSDKQIEIATAECATRLSVAELWQLVDELHSASKRLRQLRRLHWAGTQIRDYCHHIQLCVDDTHAWISVLGMEVHSESEIAGLAGWLERWHAAIAGDHGEAAVRLPLSANC